MEKILFDRHTAWTSNDVNIWTEGSFKFWEWLEIRENSKRITLSRWTQSKNKLAQSINEIVRAYLVESETKFIRLHESWKITSFLKNNIDDWIMVLNLNKKSYNMWLINTWVNNSYWNSKYWFILTERSIIKWDYNPNLDNLWLYNTESDWILSNSRFTTTSNWTIWTNWSIGNWYAQHTSWTAGSLTQDITRVPGKRYRIEINCLDMVWTCNVLIGTTNIATLNSDTANKTIVKEIIASGSWVTISLNAISIFNWQIQSILIQESSITEYSNYTSWWELFFNSFCPFIVIQNQLYIGNGSKIILVNTSLANWDISNAIQIDYDFIIKWLTQIGDQVFIYATDWQNSKQYLWNWASEYVTTSITWKDKNINNVANFWNKDLVITKSLKSNKTTIRQVNWYGHSKLFTNSENNNISKERIFFSSDFTNAIETIEDKLLIPSNNGIYTYWEHTSWLWHWLTKEYRFYGWNIWEVWGQWIITAMSYNEGNWSRLFYSLYWINEEWEEWIYEFVVQIKNWYISNENITSYLWFLETHNLYWEAFSNIKIFQKIIIWAKLETNTFINVYIKNEFSTIKYVNIYCKNNWVFNKWSIYKSWDNTFIIYEITKVWNECILHATYNWDDNYLGWNFIKQNWEGEDSFFSKNIKYWFKYIWKIISTTDLRHIILNSESFNQISLWLELISTNLNNTPYLYNYILYYEESWDD